MVKLLFPLLLIFTTLRASPVPDKEEMVMIKRIEYIMHLKAMLGQQYWPGFSTLAGDVPLVYFTDSATYAANPTRRFIEQFRPVVIYIAPQLIIYKTPVRINETPFHMSTGLELLDTTAFNFRAPFMFCSSLEAVKKVVPDIGSTEEWATMILHEYFHGFQYRHTPMIDQYMRRVLPVSADSLGRIYHQYTWFKKMTDEENELLLQAIQSTDTAATHTSIQRFLLKRKEKRAMYKEVLHQDISYAENFYEKLEGTARYVEFQLLRSFHQLTPDTGLQRVDTAYTSNRHLKDFRLETATWLYQTARSANYVYATGFNMARLLDKLNRPYKDQLFTNGALSLESLLAEAP